MPKPPWPSTPSIRYSNSRKPIGRVVVAAGGLAAIALWGSLAAFFGAETTLPVAGRAGGNRGSGAIGVENGRLDLVTVGRDAQGLLVRVENDGLLDVVVLRLFAQCNPLGGPVPGPSQGLPYHKSPKKPRKGPL